MKRRWKILWWTVGGCVTLFIVLAVLGAIFNWDEEGPEQEAVAVQTPPAATQTAPPSTPMATPDPTPTATPSPEPTASPTPRPTLRPTERPTVIPQVTPKPRSGTSIPQRKSATPARPTPVTPSKPSWCRHYDAWASATAIADRLERRHGDDATTWPARDLNSWFDAMDDRGAAANRLWDAAPSSYRWSDVRKACN